jgi:hypothetical protein
MFTLASEYRAGKPVHRAAELAHWAHHPFLVVGPARPGPGPVLQTVRDQLASLRVALHQLTRRAASLGLSAPDSCGSPGLHGVGLAHSTSALYAHACVWHSCLIRGVSLSLCRQAAGPGRATSRSSSGMFLDPYIILLLYGVIVIVIYIILVLYNVIVIVILHSIVIVCCHCYCHILYIVA